MLKPGHAHKADVLKYYSPQHVVVACNGPGSGGGGWLSFLDMRSGMEAGRADLGGHVRALPAVDPWQGLIWVPAHGRRLCLCRAPGAVQVSHVCEVYLVCCMLPPCVLQQMQTLSMQNAVIKLVQVPASCVQASSSACAGFLPGSLHQWVLIHSAGAHMSRR